MARASTCPLAPCWRIDPVSDTAAPPSGPEIGARTTPLHELHVELGGKMVDFAGWSLPVQYPAGIMAEHKHCRDQAGLFDVSHMGQVRLCGADAAAAFERLVPGNIQGLKPGQARYTQFTNDQGGTLDDLIASRTEDGLFVVVNAGCRDADIAHMRAHLEPDCAVEELTEQALLALQGPAAVDVLRDLAPEAADLTFMHTMESTLAGVPARISRLGYTGEDGFEISVADSDAVDLARRLLGDERVQPIGLGARDSLRLEAGLCLYGHELSEAITPVEAGLAWSIGKRRREEGSFPGAAVIQEQLVNGPARVLVGIRPEGRAPAREGTEIQDRDGRAIGLVTSGGFGPTVGGPVSMGYVPPSYAEPGTGVVLAIRGKAHPAEVVRLPFVPHRYQR
ncbi:MAG: glycine cleavage system aminomethyltransferase GcvT [Rhizobiales bacterium]|nr:glycine cleavage system aminomethyltransferase GcvT [Hyphomicrobiales bacterium]